MSALKATAQKWYTDIKRLKFIKDFISSQIFVVAEGSVTEKKKRFLWPASQQVLIFQI
jgi:hypothetical protein